MPSVPPHPCSQVFKCKAYIRERTTFDQNCGSADFRKETNRASIRLGELSELDITCLMVILLHSGHNKPGTKMHGLVESWGNAEILRKVGACV